MSAAQIRALLVDDVRARIVALAEALEFGLGAAGDDQKLTALIAYRDALEALDVRAEPVTFPDPPNV